MPYPNEHSCRLREPGEFQPESFVRTSRKHEGKEYDVIQGRLKGEDALTDQAFRYAKESWSASEARRHCEDHDGSFEAAEGDGAQGAEVPAVANIGLRPRGTEAPAMASLELLPGNGSVDVALRYPRVAAYVYGAIWAILPEKLATILELLTFYRAGGKFSPSEVQERLAAVRIPAPPEILLYAEPMGGGEGWLLGAGPGAAGNRRSQTVAVLPLWGIIAHRANLMVETSGGTSIERFTAAFRQALADSSIDSIVIDVDSPGGTVSGVDEISGEIHRGRGQKPIVAVANSLAASAAYWIGTAADELTITPTGEVGSIGVLAVHEDLSQALEMQGVKLTLISAGKYKAEGNPYEALGEEGRAAIQERVDEYYGMFSKAVARNRGVGVAQVREGFGEGRVVGARRALELGMADRIETLDETVERLMRKRPPGVPPKGGNRGAEAEIEYRRRRLRAAAREG